jgi:hypothetical protein
LFKTYTFKRLLTLTIIVGLLLFQPLTVAALTSSEAKQEWYNAKEASRDAQETHRKANIQWAANKTDENNKKVIDTGKDALQAALDEAESWLIWRDLEVKENPEIPADLKQRIQQDVETNLDKIDELRAEVDGIENRLQLAIVFIKMVGKYIELVADVARNTGLIWVHLTNTYIEALDNYEAQLREASENLGNDELTAKLDKAAEELASARTNIDQAETEYNEVVIPGNPILKFMNGNQHLRIAKNHMLTAHSNLKQAYRLLVETG